MHNKSRHIFIFASITIFIFIQDIIATETKKKNEIGPSHGGEKKSSDRGAFMNYLIYIKIDMSYINV